ncbi:MAG TPA: tetratricopeptide repeat protein, partial [Gammaproteobacteria bacterium]|nr:tetratricopeptide repeat protein [Gammaproteobacteria bacterium]
MLSQARIHEIDRLSAKGDVEALCKNGLLHLNGNRGIDKNSQQQAIFWFTYAAKKGNTFAKGVLSLMDQKHPDNEIKMDKVIELILDLAKTKKDAASQNTLGFMYEFGVGVTKNIKEALHFYGQAADQGLADAQFTLGLLNEMGQLGLPKNGAEAHRLYGLAASQGNSYAQNNLALILERGLYGEQKDEKEAVRLFREAAKQGNSDAEANLAEILQLGLNG